MIDVGEAPLMHSQEKTLQAINGHLTWLAVVLKFDGNSQRDPDVVRSRGELDTLRSR